MTEWLIRRLPVLGLIVAVAAALVALLSSFVGLAAVATASRVDGWAPVWLLSWAVLKLAVIGLAYGLFLRLLILCDDVAALRRAKTASSSGTDYPS
jgi:hypothetical protein